MAIRGIARVTGAIGVLLLLSGFSVAPAARGDQAMGPSGARVGPGVWAARYNGPGDGSDHLADIAVSGDGTRVVVTGNSSGNNSDYATVAYDAATGSQEWVARYRGPGGSDIARGVAITPDGSTVIVSGESYGGSTLTDFATIAYDAATGAERWVARYNGSQAEDHGLAVATGGDGSLVFVTGSSGRHYSFDYATVAYDVQTGAQRWVATYSGPGGNGDTPAALAVSPDGSRVIVTGSSVGGSHLNDLATVAYDSATGAEQWVARFDSGRSDLASALALSTDGSTVAVSSIGSSGPSEDYRTVTYEADTGLQRWTATYSGPGDEVDIPTDVAITPDGSAIVVTGYSNTGVYFDYATVAYDAATGDQRWLALYDGPAQGADWGNAVEVTPDGRKVLVTGFSNGVNTNFDYATVAYDAATGTQLRVARAGRQADDYGNDLAISPDGSLVFVGGSFGGKGSFDEDYGTIAYEG